MAERPLFSPEELSRVAELERRRSPFLIWRGADGDLHVIDLHDRREITVGRRSSSDLALTGDPEASRAHARFECHGEDWVILDDGISRNGTFLAGARITNRRRLSDGDEIRFGQTVVQFHNPSQGSSVVTNVSVTTIGAEQLTDTQRRILAALCRPLREIGPYAPPASNPEIAREVFLGVDAVKGHLRELYRRFGIDLPQNQKRARMAEQCLRMGLGGP